MNGKFKYAVVAQRSDGQIVEKEYKVGWDPEKVESAFVAMSAVAELNVSQGGRTFPDGSREFKFAPISAQLVTE